MRKRMRVVQRTSGRGSISGAAVQSISARYELTIRQTVYEGTMLDGSKVVDPGLYSISGKVMPLSESTFDLMDEDDLTLTLKDGRQLGISIADSCISFGRLRQRRPWSSICVRDEMSILDGIDRAQNQL